MNEREILEAVARAAETAGQALIRKVCALPEDRAMALVRILEADGLFEFAGALRTEAEKSKERG